MLMRGMAELRNSLEDLGLYEDMAEIDCSLSESRLPTELVERC